MVIVMTVYYWRQTLPQRFRIGSNKTAANNQCGNAFFTRAEWGGPLGSYWRPFCFRCDTLARLRFVIFPWSHA